MTQNKKVKIDESLMYETFFKTCKDGDIKLFQSLIQDYPLDPSYNYNEAIQLACENGHLQIVKLLLGDPRVDPSDWSNESIQHASGNGHTKIVQLLMKDSRVDPSDNDNQAMRDACENGHIEIVRLFLKDSRIDLTDHESIENACRNGHIHIVKLLLHANHSCDYEKLFELAYEGSKKGVIYYTEMMNLFLPHVDVRLLFNLEFRDIVESGNVDKVRILLKDKRLMKGGLCNALVRAKRIRNVEMMNILIEDGRINPNLRFQCALLIDRHDVLKRLLNDKKLEPSYDHVRFFDYTVRKDDLKMVKKILKDDHFKAYVRSNKHAYDDIGESFIHACKKGYADIVYYLIQRYEVCFYKVGDASILAAKNAGHTNLVELLTLHYDAKKARCDRDYYCDHDLD